MTAAGSPLAPCSAPTTAAALVGATGSTTRLTRTGGTPSVVEYATTTTSPRAAYVTAVRFLQTSAACRADSTDHSRTSTFDEVLPLPTQGDASVCMVFSDTSDGTALQSGYEIVRDGRTVVVVGYTDSGTLDAPALQHVTAVALAKLGGSAGSAG